MSKKTPQEGPSSALPPYKASLFFLSSSLIIGTLSCISCYQTPHILKFSGNTSIPSAHKLANTIPQQFSRFPSIPRNSKGQINVCLDKVETSKTTVYLIQTGPPSEIPQSRRHHNRSQRGAAAEARDGPGRPRVRPSAHAPAKTKGRTAKPRPCSHVTKSRSAPPLPPPLPSP